MKRSFGILLAIALFASCSPSTSMKVLKPAAIYIPDHIQTIGTLDRSKPESGFKNFLEGFLTGEEIGQDKRGRRAAIKGFSTVLEKTPRFTVRPIETELTGSKDGASMSSPLPWSEVEQLCKTYQVDAIATLEMFDSDQFVNKSSRNEKYKDKNNKEQSRSRYYVERKLEVRTGFRIYDNVNKVVLDEFVTSGLKSDEGNGLSPTEATNNLRNIFDQVQEVGNTAGSLYAKRIAPLYETITRTFQRKVPTNKDAHKKALEAAKLQDWQKAAEIWNNMATTSTNIKTKAKAAYNMAIVCEAQGKLQLAADWAEKSYKNFGLKAGRSYLDQIKRRIEENKQVEIQMKSRTKT